MTKKELTQKIKNYIKNHKEMQQDIINVCDLDKCAKECNCHRIYVMQVVSYGRIF